MINPTTGAGFRKEHTIEADKQKCKGILQITNNDNICLARAIVSSLTYTEDGKSLFRQKLAGGDKAKQINMDYIRKSKYAEQRVYVQTLHNNAGVPMNRCGISELEIFETYLDIDIHLHNYASTGGIEHIRYPEFTRHQYDAQAN